MINAMSLSDPKLLYVKLLHALLPERARQSVSPQVAAEELQQLFVGPKRRKKPVFVLTPFLLRLNPSSPPPPSRPLCLLLSVSVFGLGLRCIALLCVRVSSPVRYSFCSHSDRICVCVCVCVPTYRVVVIDEIDGLLTKNQVGSVMSGRRRKHIAIGVAFFSSPPPPPSVVASLRSTDMTGVPSHS